MQMSSGNQGTGSISLRFESYPYKNLSSPSIAQRIPAEAMAAIGWVPHRKEYIKNEA
jgi:hypothetical protein